MPCDSKWLQPRGGRAWPSAGAEATNVFPRELYLLWCSSWETWPQFVTAVSVCHSSPTLPPLSPTPLPPSVVSSREHQKTNTMLRITKQRSTFSRQTKTNSLLRPELCFLNRGNKGKKKLPAWSVTFELTFWPIQLTSCRKIQTCSLEKSSRTGPIGGSCKAHVSEFCLHCCIFILKKKKEKNGKSCNWQSFLPLACLELNPRKACLTFPRTSPLFAWELSNVLWRCLTFICQPPLFPVWILQALPAGWQRPSLPRCADQKSTSREWRWKGNAGPVWKEAVDDDLERLWKLLVKFGGPPPPQTCCSVILMNYPVLEAGGFTSCLHYAKWRTVLYVLYIFHSCARRIYFWFKKKKS